MPSRTLQLYTTAPATDFNKAPDASGRFSSVPEPQAKDRRVSLDRIGALLADLSSDAAVWSDLINFRRAFEYRASIDWLGESGRFAGRRNRDGIAYALRAALAKYNPCAYEAVEETPNALNEGGIDPDERRWLERFVNATSEVAKDDLSMIRFAWAVTDVEQCDDLNKVSDAVMRKHLLSALRQYTKHYDSGTSIEPW